MMPPLCACSGASALKVRGVGLAWGEDAPFPVARRADSHCTCCGSTQAFPARLRIMMSGRPPHPRPRQDPKPSLHRPSRAARSARRLRHPHKGNARKLSGRTCRRLGARRPRHGAERAARGGDGSQRLRRQAYRSAAPSARSALGAQLRAPSAERVARGGDQARRRRRARSAHATGAAPSA